MRAYILNLHTAPQRRISAQNECGREGVYAEVFYAFNNNQHGLPSNKPYMSPGAVGCFISHLMLIQQLHNRQDEVALIFEDDIKLPANFRQRCAHVLRTLPADWDIAFLGWTTQRTGEVLPHANDASWIKVKGALGMHAYLVKRNSVFKILQELQLMINHVDIQLAQAIEQGRLNGYWLRENMVAVNQFPSQIPK